MTEGGPHLRRQLRLQLERLAGEGTWGLSRPADARVASEGVRSGPIEEGGPSSSRCPILEGELAPHAERAEPLNEVARQALGCTLCRLSETRTKVVFGVGDPRARLMFIGEGPGRDEDRQGEPFVGAAGGLLDRIIAAMGLERDAVYIANTVKCRPPQNRNPLPDELDACRSYLLRQVAAVRPEVIVLLGRVAAQAILQTDAPLGRLRGRFHDWCGIPVMCTYHPAYLLRKPEDKGKAWEDIQAVMRRLSGERT